MASTSRRTNISLKRKALFCCHNMFHVIWTVLQKEKRTLRECIRFHVNLDLAFSENDFKTVKFIDKKYHIYLNSTGLVGAQGTLPLYLKEGLLKAPKEQQVYFIVLYDLLQERSFQLAYEGWARRRVITHVFHSKSPTSRLLNSITGISNVTVSSSTLLTNYRHYYAAHFSNPRRSQRALQQMLQEIIGLPVNIISLLGNWISLAPNQCTILGAVSPSCLGKNSLCGSKIWSFQTKMCLVIGPIPSEDIPLFLPEAENFLLIKYFLSQYLNQPMQWDMQLIIDKASILSCALSSESWNRLGQSSFLNQLPKTELCSEIKFPLLQSNM